MKIKAVLVVGFVGIILLSSTFVMFLTPPPTLSEISSDEDGNIIAISTNELGETVREDTSQMVINFDNSISDRTQWVEFNFDEEYLISMVNQTMIFIQNSTDDKICLYDKDFEVTGCVSK